MQDKVAIEIKGCPSFKTTKWCDKTHFLDVVKEFEICIGKNTATIIFSSNPIVLKVINGKVIFGFDTNNLLCFFEIKDITENETLKLNNYLEKVSY